MSFITIKDLDLHYLEFGESDEVVVFVHGNWCSARCWLPTMARLPRRYRALALDQRGFGFSSKPDDGYSMGQRAADLEGFVDALGLTRFHLVGHSLGGAVAAQFALDYPGRLRSLFLLDAPPPTGMAISPEVRALQDRFGAERAILEPALAIALGLPQSDPFFQALLDDAWAMARPAIQHNLSALEQWQVADRLASLRLPVTVAWGRNDLVVPQAAAEELHQRISGSRYHIFDDLGHSPNLEDPDRFVSELLTALYS